VALQNTVLDAEISRRAIPQAAPRVSVPPALPKLARDIVIVQAFGMLLNQVENIFFICLLSHKDSTHKNVRSQ